MIGSPLDLVVEASCAKSTPKDNGDQAEADCVRLRNTLIVAIAKVTASRSNCPRRDSDTWDQVRSMVCNCVFALAERQQDEVLRASCICRKHADGYRVMRNSHASAISKCEQSYSAVLCVSLPGSARLDLGKHKSTKHSCMRKSCQAKLSCWLSSAVTCKHEG